MAKAELTFGKLGVKFTETDLWVNTSTALYYTGGEVTLENPLTDYDEIRFYCKWTLADSSGSDTYSAAPLTFNSGSYTTHKCIFHSIGFFHPSNSVVYVRTLTWDLANPKKVTISNAGSGDVAYPVKITGVKYKA